MTDIEFWKNLSELPVSMVGIVILGIILYTTNRNLLKFVEDNTKALTHLTSAIQEMNRQNEARQEKCDNIREGLVMEVNRLKDYGK